MSNRRPSPPGAYQIEMTVTCRECDRRVDGAMVFTARNQIMESTGFMVFSEPPGVACEECLGPMEM